MTAQINLPPYTYQDPIPDSSLMQGDILKVEGKFREYFKDFYPAINHTEDTIKYVMVLTQSCDLVKNHKRKPKVNHINVCLVRSLRSLIEKLINDEIKPTSIDGKNLLEKDALDKLKDKLSKLLNNSDQKMHFFLPNKSPFTEDMIALLPLSFSFRTDHYDLMLNMRVLGLKPEFQAKLGHIISQLYGRIGTQDLYDSGWDDKKTRSYINALLSDLNLKQVPDKSFIDYISANFIQERSDVETLIQECQAKKVDISFQPLKNELIQNIKNHLIQLFQDKAKITSLAGMDKPTLSKEITTTISQAIAKKS